MGLGETEKKHHLQFKRLTALSQSETQDASARRWMTASLKSSPLLWSRPCDYLKPPITGEEKEGKKEGEKGESSTSNSLDSISSSFSLSHFFYLDLFHDLAPLALVGQARGEDGRAGLRAGAAGRRHFEGRERGKKREFPACRR